MEESPHSSLSLSLSLSLSYTHIHSLFLSYQDIFNPKRPSCISSLLLFRHVYASTFSLYLFLFLYSKFPFTRSEDRERERSHRPEAASPKRLCTLRWHLTKVGHWSRKSVKINRLKTAQLIVDLLWVETWLRVRRNGDSSQCLTWLSAAAGHTERTLRARVTLLFAGGRFLLLPPHPYVFYP